MTYDEIKDLDAGSYFGDEEEFKNAEYLHLRRS